MYLISSTFALIAVVAGIASYFYDSTPTLFECAYVGDMLCLNLLANKHLAVDESQKELFSTQLASLSLQSLNSTFDASQTSPITLQSCTLLSASALGGEEKVKQASEYLIFSRDARNNTIAHWAAKSNQKLLLQCLLNLTQTQGIPVEAVLATQNNAGTAPLHWASTSDNNLSTLFFLLQSVPQQLSLPEGTLKSISYINMPNNAGEAALHWSVEWEAYNTTLALLLLGANPMAKDEHNNTPLHKIRPECNEREDCRKIFALLIKFGAIVTEENAFKRTPLQHFNLKTAPPPSDIELGFRGNGLFDLGEDLHRKFTLIAGKDWENQLDHTRKMIRREKSLTGIETNTNDENKQSNDEEGQSEIVPDLIPTVDLNIESAKDDLTAQRLAKRRARLYTLE